MGIWSSIRDFYFRWKPELDLYGISALLILSAIITDRWAAAGIVFIGMLIMDAMRRWGEPYRQLGKAELERRRRENKAYWDERFAEWFGRFQKDPDDAPPPAATRLIPQPRRDDEEPPPESPALIVEEEKPVIPVPPPVTHET
ncbi:hypothetical protein WJU23_03430 [Prosthecobacter sp. SYSU 5D2]|uniref:hypothetical protein n=1 Tax=Prosthecobacter sp. SYSU 5D2 TaxID=3134134 RepID=UPI0031FE697F